jgi:hypothetical protein
VDKLIIYNLAVKWSINTLYKKLQYGLKKATESTVVCMEISEKMHDEEGILHVWPKAGLI